jgi:hypothetical protein
LLHKGSAEETQTLECHQNPHLPTLKPNQRRLEKQFKAKPPFQDLHPPGITSVVTFVRDGGVTGNLDGALRDDNEVAHLFLIPNLPTDYTIWVQGQYPQVRGVGGLWRHPLAG